MFGGNKTELPPTSGPYDPKGKPGGAGANAHNKSSCSHHWEKRGIFTLTLIGVGVFIAFVVVLWSKGEDLEMTSRATVMMHDETVKMKTDVETWLKNFRSNFHTNQEVITTEQVLDSIDKMHATIAWMNELRSGLSPTELQLMLKNANTIVSNVARISELFGSLGGGGGGGSVSSTTGTSVNVTTLRQKNSSAKEEKEADLMDKMGTFINKGSQLIGSVSADEFHGTVLAFKSGLETVVRVSQNVSSAKVNEIVDKVSDILAAAESEHVIETISRVTKGVIEIIDRINQPIGINPLAAAAASVANAGGGGVGPVVNAAAVNTKMKWPEAGTTKK